MQIETRRQNNPPRGPFAILLVALPVMLALSPRGVRPDQLFEGGAAFPVDRAPVEILLDDFDLDGRLDAAALGEGGVDVLRGAPALLFDPAVNTGAGLSPISMASGDLNGDRYPDVVVANGGSSTLSILLNRAGALAPQAQVPVGLNPRAVVLADFDRDGDLDAVTSNLQTQSVGVLLGDGHGDFRETPSFWVGDNPHALVAGDYDVDGEADLVVAHSGAVSWFQGKGDGSFGSGVDTPIFPDPRVLSSGDLDLDGAADLAVITDERNLLRLENLGRGAFREEPVSTLPRRNIFERMLQPLIADMTADGLPDLLAVIAGVSDARLLVHANDGNGVLVERDSNFLSSPVNAIAIADLDLDGKLDVASARSDAAEVVFFRGTGPGRIATRQVVALDAGPRDLLALDTNLDGAPDLVTLSSDALWIVQQDAQGGFEPPRPQKFPSSAFQDLVAGDFDGDHGLDLTLADLAGDKAVVVLLDRGVFRSSVEHPLLGLPSQLAAADLDGDGWRDFAATDQAASSALVIFHAGDIPGSSRVELPVEASQAAIAAADMDADGALDLALAARDGGRIFYGDGRRAFPRSIRLERFASSPALRTADLDQDGWMDLAGVSRSKISILFHAGGAAGVRRESEVLLGSEARALEAFDIDGDNWLDLLATTATALNVARGSRDGFSAPESYAVGSSPRAIAMADFNGDSLVDAATADFGDRSISILHRRGGTVDRTFRRGDSDANGAANTADAIRILALLFLGAGAPSCADSGDVNDDGAVSLTDALALLLHLFQGGGEPPSPGAAACGEDPTPDSLEPCADGCR